jgi:cell migration-inducing and hyaluronan-binding protein
MHGAVRQYTWTRIASTVKAGDSQLTVLDSVDWKVGEKIAIASTSYNHMES